MRRVVTTKKKEATVRRVDLRLTSEDHARLGCVASAENKSPSEWIVAVVRERYRDTYGTRLAHLLETAN